MSRTSLSAYSPRFASLRAAFWLLAAATLLLAYALVAQESYTVKRGDTIYGIAQLYGIAPAALAERNGLSRNAFVYTGQRLVIPVKSAARRRTEAARKSSSLVLPRSVQRAIDNAPVRTGRWKYIVIHHSDVDTGTVRGMDKYHREVRHMENGLAYHFVIGNGSGMGDGEIAVCPRWTRQLDGGHLASEEANKVALGICLVGNFDKHLPTGGQMDSLRVLVEALMDRCQLTPRAVKMHRQINIVQTRCPGSQFPIRSFLNSLESPRG